MDQVQRLCWGISLRYREGPHLYAMPRLTGIDPRRRHRRCYVLSYYGFMHTQSCGNLDWLLVQGLARAGGKYIPHSWLKNTRYQSVYDPVWDVYAPFDPAIKQDLLIEHLCIETLRQAYTLAVQHGIIGPWCCQLCRDMGTVSEEQL